MSDLRIEPFADDNATSVDARELLYFAAAEGSPDPRLVRIMGRSSAGIALLRAWRSVFYGGVLPVRMKELMRIRFTAREQCGYCSSLRTQRAIDEGVTQQVLNEMVHFEESTLISDREKAALRFCDLWSQDAIADDAVFEDLRLHFTDEEIVELGCVMIFQEGSRFAKALNIVTWDRACEIDTTLREHASASA